MLSSEISGEHEGEETLISSGRHRITSKASIGNMILLAEQKALVSSWIYYQGIPEPCFKAAYLKVEPVSGQTNIFLANNSRDPIIIKQWCLLSAS